MEKAALVSGAISLVAAPMMADAAVIKGTGGPVSVSFADLPGGAGFQAIDVPRDVDGVNGADFFLYAARSVSTYVSGSGANISLHNGYNGLAISTYSSAPRNGIGFVANTSTSGFARLATSTRVGLTLAAGRYLISSADAVATYGYNVQYGPSSYGGTYALAIGDLQPGVNKIGFAFDVNGGDRQVVDHNPNCP